MIDLATGLKLPEQVRHLHELQGQRGRHQPRDQVVEEGEIGDQDRKVALEACSMTGKAMINTNASHGRNIA